MLSTDERQRVIDALDFDPDAGNVVSLVARFRTSAEIHQFVLNYNSNDGLLPLRAIVEMPACDLGTALCIYWFLGDFVMDRESYSDETDPDWDGVGLIEEVETRVKNGFYKNQGIRFVPLDYLDWSPTKLKRMKLQYRGELPFPEMMLQASPGEDVPQESLV